jgi:hypothetical protein
VEQKEARRLCKDYAKERWASDKITAWIKLNSFLIQLANVTAEVKNEFCVSTSPLTIPRRLK